MKRGYKSDSWCTCWFIYVAVQWKGKGIQMLTAEMKETVDPVDLSIDSDIRQVFIRRAMNGVVQWKRPLFNLAWISSGLILRSLLRNKL